MKRGEDVLGRKERLVMLIVFRVDKYLLFLVIVRLVLVFFEEY